MIDNIAYDQLVEIDMAVATLTSLGLTVSEDISATQARLRTVNELDVAIGKLVNTTPFESPYPSGVRWQREWAAMGAEIRRVVDAVGFQLVPKPADADQV